MRRCSLCTEDARVNIRAPRTSGAYHTFCSNCCNKLFDSSLISPCLLSCRRGDHRIHHLNPQIRSGIQMSVEDEGHPSGLIPATVQKMKERVQHLKTQFEEQEKQHQVEVLDLLNRFVRESQDWYKVVIYHVLL
ncbi:hypothetical protein FPV67DRAFT_1449060 [Lyophyllum atratum]|nr:hypothetical protein FPV67DRAFT_1449060 [Lyophyllum atratum]